MTDHQPISCNDKPKSRLNFHHNPFLTGLVVTWFLFTVICLYDRLGTFQWHPLVFPRPDTAFVKAKIRPVYVGNHRADLTSPFHGTTQLLFRRTNVYQDLENLSFNGSEKLILVWFDGHENFQSSGAQAFSSCPAKRCALTTNREYFNRSDAVLFLANYMSCQSDIEPVRTSPKQIFIFHMGESPVHAPICGFMQRKDFFNWTMTYRLDSDVRTHYTYRVRLERSFRNFAKEKTKLVTWVVSHCKTQGGRERYIKKLKKYISVDVFGKCGNLTYGEDCIERLKDYKFYLAFENSMCRDYITEKMVNALEHETVPIVYGDGDYRIFPANSYIHAYNFSSPAKLAAFLLMLDRNATAYNAFMQWRYRPKLAQSSGPFSTRENGLCQLCRKLHRKMPSKSYFSMKSWWTYNMDRTQPSKPLYPACRDPQWLFEAMNITRRRKSFSRDNPGGPFRIGPFAG